VVPLRISVVGAGLMGRFHARAVSEHPRTELADVVDASPEAEAVAWERRARWLRDVDELLEGPSLPDAAIVSVPTSDHAPVALRLLQAGVPVLVEKPIASTLEEARALIDAARAAGATLAVGHVERFNPAVRALQERLRGDELGRVFQIHARRLSPFPRRIGDTGVAHDLATHDLDIMCRLAGTPVRISSETDRKAHGTREDLLAALLRFDSGAIGLLEVNWLTPTKVRQLTVTGERGMFVVDYLEQHLTLYENAQATERWPELDVFDGVTEGNVTRYAISREEPIRAQLEAFVDAVRGEAPVAVTGEDGLQVLELALAAIEANGRTIELAATTVS
jgi:UDP-N-acetylglucosamine 3-dehydrogenase